MHRLILTIGLILFSNEVQADDTSILRALLHYHGVKPVDVSTVENQASLKDTIIVVYGKPAPNSGIDKLVNKTLRDGGSVLMAVETELSLKSYLPDGRENSIAGRQISNTAKYFIQLQALDNSQKFYWILVDRPSTIGMTEGSTYIDGAVPLPYTAGMPKFIAYGAGRDEKLPWKLTVLSSERTLRNDQMTAKHPENPSRYADNFIFANHLVQWLIGPEKRQKCLFVTYGSASTKFDDIKLDELKYTLPDEPIPIPFPNLMDREFQTMAATFADEAIAGLENEGKLSDGLGQSRSDFYLRYLGIFFVVTVCIAILYLGLRLCRQMMKWDARILPNDPYKLGTTVAIGSLTHRRRELMRSPNLREPFVDVLRRMFADRGYTGPYERTSKVPKVTSTSKRASLTPMISVLWEEAVNVQRPLLYTRWLELEPLYSAVRSAAEADLWRFDTAPDNAA